MAFGLVFWPVVITLWFTKFRKKMPRAARDAGSVLVLGLPAVAALSMSYWMFVQEPLLSASADGNVPRMKQLIAFGANPSEESDGGTPLFFAAGNGHIEAVRVLLAAGANAKQRPTFPGMTPLKSAVDGKHTEIVALLRGAGETE